MAHLFNVLYEGLHSHEEGLEFRTGPKPLQVSVFGIPLDSKDVVSCILRAVREFISQTMTGRFERSAGSLVGCFEGFASRLINLVPRIFNNHALSPELSRRPSATKDCREIDSSSGNLIAQSQPCCAILCS